jgi:hypothetical protein
MTPNAHSLLESLANEGSQHAATDPDSAFKVKLKEDEISSALKPSTSAPVKQSETLREVQ